ncbi:MAG: ATP-binding protein [Psychroflexus sp.]
MDNIFFKRFDAISSKDIDHLIKIGYEERLRIEYKKEMYVLDNKKDKIEMLKDISAMANASGGYLIIGIKEKDKEPGVPEKWEEIPHANKHIDSIKQCCLANIEPHIELNIRPIIMETNKKIILIHIPRSSKKPHMVTLRHLKSKHVNKFWIRHHDRNIEMTVDEIRDACLSVDNIWKDVKEFINERKQEIKNEIKSKPYLIIGSSPIFIKEDIVDIKDKKICNYLAKPPGISRGDYYVFKNDISSNTNIFDSPSPSLYGLKINEKNVGAVELFRNGYYELIVNWKMILVFQSNIIANDILVAYIDNYFRVMMNLMKLLGIEQTIISYLSLYNISDSKLVNQNTTNFFIGHVNNCSQFRLNPTTANSHMPYFSPFPY